MAGSGYEGSAVRVSSLRLLQLVAWAALYESLQTEKLYEPALPSPLCPVPLCVCLLLFVQHRTQY